MPQKKDEQASDSYFAAPPPAVLPKDFNALSDRVNNLELLVRRIDKLERTMESATWFGERDMSHAVKALEAQFGELATKVEDLEGGRRHVAKCIEMYNANFESFEQVQLSQASAMRNLSNQVLEITAKMQEVETVQASSLKSCKGMVDECGTRIVAMRKDVKEAMKNVAGDMKRQYASIHEMWRIVDSSKGATQMQGLGTNLTSAGGGNERVDNTNTDETRRDTDDVIACPHAFPLEESGFLSAPPSTGEGNSKPPKPTPPSSDSSSAEKVLSVKPIEI
jgi:hypothetical protein